MNSLVNIDGFKISFHEKSKRIIKIIITNETIDKRNTLKPDWTMFSKDTLRPIAAIAIIKRFLLNLETN